MNFYQSKILQKNNLISKFLNILKYEKQSDLITIILDCFLSLFKVENFEDYLEEKYFSNSFLLSNGLSILENLQKNIKDICVLKKLNNVIDNFYFHNF